MEGNSSPTRIFLWTIPRSVSTAFERCMIGLGKVALIHEPYTAAYFFGPDRKFFKAPFIPVEHDYSFAKVKNMLEADFHDKDFVFSKDHAFTLGEQYDMLPDGFIHTILIRNPIRSHYSFYKVCNGPLLRHYSFLDNVLPGGYAFKELYDLYEYLKETTGKDPVVIDSEDLLKYPEQMVRRYCDAIGVPFKESLLDWDPNVNVTHTWASSLKMIQHAGVYDKALTTTGFTYKESKMVDVLSLPQEYQRAIKVSLPYYDKLFERRLVPEDRETEV